ncbi:MAG TPA: amylovoran biosynthesis protein AmsE [Lachnospiraceae bacterium]|nr:amylovoran biosynthesis protein AmsE [Lachnospiraceae bacterium]
MNDLGYSVLMSVYYKEKAEFLWESMESIYNQTVPTDDFVLVCDGKLKKSLETVINKMQIKFGDVLHVVRLEENSGLGNALNKGMKYCRHELVARMDSDDISIPERCAKQIQIFLEQPRVSIVSGTVLEFSGTAGKADAQRRLPERQEDIIKFAKKRNPFNHPCVMFKKSKVEAAGGYQDLYLLEDYYLWLRMLRNGCQGYNLQEPLLWMRADAGLYKRRGGWKYAKSQVALLHYMKKQEVINTSEFFICSVTRGIMAVIPDCIREELYWKLVREKV